MIGLGTLTIGDAGTANFAGSFSQDVTFTGVGVLGLGDPADYQGNISGLLVGDVIDLTGMSPSSVTSTSLNNGVLTVDLASGGPLTFNVAGALTGAVFVPVSDGSGGTALELAPSSSDVWVGGGDGVHWSNDGNWTEGEPTASTNAQIYIPVGVTIVDDDINSTVNGLVAFGPGTLDLAAGVALVTNAATSVGDLELESGSILEATSGNLVLSTTPVMNVDLDLGIPTAAISPSVPATVFR